MIAQKALMAMANSLTDWKLSKTRELVTADHQTLIAFAPASQI